MYKLVFLPAALILISSCIKNRECTYYDHTGVKVATINVLAPSHKRAVEKCQLRSIGGDKKKAKQAVAANPPDCRIE